MKSSRTVITADKLPGIEAEPANFYTAISILLLLLGWGKLAIGLKLRYPVRLRSFHIFISTLASSVSEQVGLINQLRVVPAFDTIKNERWKAYLSMSS
jgi:hypothetical protein